MRAAGAEFRASGAHGGFRSQKALVGDSPQLTLLPIYARLQKTLFQPATKPKKSSIGTFIQPSDILAPPVMITVF